MPGVALAARPGVEDVAALHIARCNRLPVILKARSEVAATAGQTRVLECGVDQCRAPRLRLGIEIDAALLEQRRRLVAAEPFRLHGKGNGRLASAALAAIGLLRRGDQ